MPALFGGERNQIAGSSKGRHRVRISGIVAGPAGAIGNVDGGDDFPGFLTFTQPQNLFDALMMARVRRCHRVAPALANGDGQLVMRACICGTVLAGDAALHGPRI